MRTPIAARIGALAKARGSRSRDETRPPAARRARARSRPRADRERRRAGAGGEGTQSLPRVIVGALDEAAGYFACTAIPLAVIFQRGKKGGIACLHLDAFAKLVGLDPASLPKPRPLRRPRPSPQLTIPGFGLPHVAP